MGIRKLSLASVLALFGAAPALAQEIPARLSEEQWDSPARILFLARAHGTELEQEIFLSAIDRVLKSPSPEGERALVELLNHDDPWRPAHAMSDSFTLIRAVRPAATEAWYAIKWKTAALPERIRLVLHAFEPDPPVHPEQDISMEKARALAMAFRKPFHELIQSEKLDFEVNPWTVNAISSAARLLDEEPFRFPDDRLDEIHQKAGPYGRAILMAHTEQRMDTKSVGWMIEWLQQYRGNIDKLNLFASSGRMFSGAKAESRQLLADELGQTGLHVLSQYTKSNNKLKDVNLMNAILVSLEALGSSAKSRDLIQTISKEEALPMPEENLDPQNVALRYLIRRVNEKASMLAQAWGVHP